MRLVFLADASHAIGSGHVMRCSAIAEEAISRGIECVFVGLVSDIAWLQERVKSVGFSKSTRPDEFIPEPTTDVLILDSYTLALDDSFIQPGRWDKIILVADASTPKYYADLVIHPGLDGSWYEGDESKFLSGSKYIPLRKTIKKSHREISSLVEEILVFGGGVDTHNFAFAIANELRNLDGFRSVTFFSSEASRIENLDARFRVFDFGSKLDSAIDSADLVFTTASTSALEVIARGIPLGITNSVLNQSVLYQALGNLGMASLVGEKVLEGDWVFDSTQILRLIRDPLYRFALVNKSLGLIDFDGASRIVNAITQF